MPLNKEAKPNQTILRKIWNSLKIRIDTLLQQLKL